MKFAIEQYKLFEKVFTMKQKEMKDYVYSKLLKYYPIDNICQTEDYIYAIGNIPIALVAHLDTVWEDAPPKYVFFDPFKNVMWTGRGLGADDRAGCLAILEILKTGLKPHVIFTTDEEIGGVGACELASIPCPFEDLRYMIELDRRGSNDCVFYDCESKPFQKYIETFGFKTAIGSFSDISMLCSSWEICGVNLSIGYYNEHTEREILFLNVMYNTITRVIKMLSVKNVPNYKWEGLTYIPSRDFEWIDYMRDWDGYSFACKKCHKPLTNYTAVAAETENGGVAYYCFDCMQKNISYCPVCNNPFENPEGINSQKLCPKCKNKKELNGYGVLPL